MLRRFLVIFSAMILLCSIGVGFMYDTLENEFKPDTSKIQVLGLPSSYQSNPRFSPYNGPHPRLIERPKETFSFPIAIGETGPVTPLFAGANKYPFLCMSEESGLGQPLVDNQEGAGVPVYAEMPKGIKNKSKIIGYSKDCSIPTQILYYYQKEKDGDFIRLKQPKEDMVVLPEAETWLRIEVGTINRYLYAIIMPVSAADLPSSPDSSLWNQKLIYQFRGGISIGYRQGVMRLSHISRDLKYQLADGYAIAFSTGTETASHYDIWLSEDTAMRVKRQFIGRYGKPKYTVGIGGSGGALQQYLIAQNRPGLIDAGIALYSYPDMATQVAYSLDCELLEYYFDETARHNKDWQDWEKRKTVLGLSSIQGYPNKFTTYKAIVDLLNFRWPSFPSGASECSNGWRGSHALINNPHFTGEYYRYAEDIVKNTQWSHWANLNHIYGTDDQGWSNSLFDNEGVQYGLKALRNGDISAETFMHLNSRIGGWKHQDSMTKEYYWHISGHGDLKDIKISSQHNMTHNAQSVPLAPRSRINPQTVKAAYQAGLIYTGYLDIPIIDLRHYLDDQLDIHHTWASFSSRLRIQDATGEMGQQVIWTAIKPHKPFKEAFDALDTWLNNIANHPERTVSQNRPLNLQDRCYNEAFELEYEGDDAWNGAWNNQSDGPCMRRFPMNSSSRMVAGEKLQSEVLKCQRQSIESAIDRGVYGDVNMSGYLDELKAIFPTGVCDYDSSPAGRPDNLIQALKSKAFNKVSQ